MRCQTCGKLSFAQHLLPIFVQHGESGAHELLCEGCYSRAKEKALLGKISVLLFLSAIVIFVLIRLWSWSQPGR
jgi:hypothetical protein